MGKKDKKDDKKGGSKPKKKKFDAKQFKVEDETPKDADEPSTSTAEPPVEKDVKDTPSKNDQKDESPKKGEEDDASPKKDASKKDKKEKKKKTNEDNSEVAASKDGSPAKKDEKGGKKKGKKEENDDVKDKKTDKKEKKPKKDKKADSEKENDAPAKLSEEAIEELMSIGEQLHTMNILIEQNSDTLMQHSEAMDEIEEPLKKIQRHTCGNYQLLWRIPGFASKYDAAKDGTESIIYSPDFKSDSEGYNMALSLCPYGDGKAAGKAMSLFFCLLKGNEDVLQAWPFAHPMTFTLLDQRELPNPSENYDGIKRNNITHYFKPNPIKENIAFLGRPTAKRNPGLGVPYFVLFDKMKDGDYVKDDTVYIKVEVHIDTVCEGKQIGSTATL